MTQSERLLGSGRRAPVHFKAGASVKGNRGGVVSRCPQPETPEATLAGPVEHRLEQGTADAMPAPRGVDPHATDPTRVRALAIEQPVRRSEHVRASTGEEHQVSGGFGDRAGEILPVGPGLRRRLGERVAEGVRDVTQRTKPEVAMEIDLA
jgi:hypothetical protein